jgi:hypothetical protein
MKKTYKKIALASGAAIAAMALVSHNDTDDDFRSLNRFAAANAFMQQVTSGKTMPAMGKQKLVPSSGQSLDSQFAWFDEI